MYNPTNNEISLTVYNMHLYYDHTVYSFPLYTFLWPEDGPQWPKHVVVSIINRVQRRLCFDVPYTLPNYWISNYIEIHSSFIVFILEREDEFGPVDWMKPRRE